MNPHAPYAHFKRTLNTTYKRPDGSVPFVSERNRHVLDSVYKRPSGPMPFVSRDNRHVLDSVYRRPTGTTFRPAA